jgi:hypothetical protein
VLPIYWALVDVTATRNGLEIVCDALLTVIESLPCCSYFGLSLIDENFHYIMNWKDDKFIKVRCDEADHSDISEFLLYEDALLSLVGGIARQAASQKVESLESIAGSSGEEYSGSKAHFGEAVKSIMRFMATGESASSEQGLHTHAYGRLLGTRIGAYLSGVPHKGVGSVLPKDKTQERENLGMEAAFYLDPIQPDFLMANLYANRDATREQTKKLTEGKESDNGSESKDGDSIDADDEVVDFYISAGAAAALLGIGIDVAIVGNTAGIDVLQHLVCLSGGRLGLYRLDSDAEGCNLEKDAYKVVTRPEYLDCQIKIRTSNELVVAGTIDSRVQEDENNIFTSARMSQEDSFAIMLEHKNKVSLSFRKNVCIQAAISYTVLKPGGQVGSIMPFCAQRYIRIINQEFPLARTMQDLFDSVDLNVYLHCEFFSSMTMLQSFGRDHARQALLESLVHVVASNKDWVKHGEYGGAGSHKLPKHQGFPDISILIECTFYLIKSFSDKRPHSLDLLKVLFLSSSTCDDLRAAILPRLTAWANADVISHVDVPLNPKAISSINESFLVLDAYDSLLLCIKEEGTKVPASGTKLMQYITSCRKLRLPTPHFKVLKGLQALLEHPILSAPGQDGNEDEQQPDVFSSLGSFHATLDSIADELILD